MTLRRGRATALIVLTLVLGILGTAAIAWPERIAEGWWLHALSSSEESERREAIARLGEMRSKRAILRLIEVIETSFDPRFPQEQLFSGEYECSLERSSRIDRLREWRCSVLH